MNTSVKENEIAYFRQIADDARRELKPFDAAVIRRYRKNTHWRLFEKEYIYKHIQDLAAQNPNGELVLGDFGCGDGEHSCEAAMVVDNTRYLGFDLSPDLIEVAKERAALNGLSARTEFVTANAEDKHPLNDAKVDVMLVLNILHHVELETVIPNLLASTKPGGLLIIREPIAYSKRLQKIRDMSGVEKKVTPDERQLSREEIDYLLEHLDEPTVQYSRLISRLTRLLPNLHKIDSGYPVTRFIAHSLLRFDYIVLRVFPFLNYFCGRVVIIGRTPLTSD